MPIEIFLATVTMKLNQYQNQETMNTQTAQETQAQVLKNKIIELQSALFFSESSSLVKLPTHVISEVEIDEEEQIWFVISRPVQHIDAFDKEIPAKLDFFKKGMDFFVKVMGTASIVTDKEEIEYHPTLSEEMKERMRDERMIAMKVRIQNAELVDNSPKPTQNWFQASRSQLSSWFF
jgi:general stress protein 26